jgi:hypothetical protein
MLSACGVGAEWDWVDSIINCAYLNIETAPLLVELLFSND